MLAWPGSGDSNGTSRDIGGYRVSRVTSSGETTVAVLGPSGATAMDELPPEARVACYRLEVVSSLGTLQGTSDVLCVFGRLSFGSGPRSISISFARPNLALVGWGSAQDATSYVFLPLGTPRGQLLPAMQTFAVDDTGGRLTCYIAAARSGTTISGISDIVCGLSRG